MKNHFITFFIIFLFAPTVWANDIYYEISHNQSVAQIQTELQNVIHNAADNDKIIVTGTKTNADATLSLNIPIHKIVQWHAIYQSNSSIGSSTLIALSGDGIFEVLDGTLITANGNTINVTSASLTVVVSGAGKVQTSGDGAHAITTLGNVEIKDNAEISGTTGEVIETTGDNSVVTVSGGSVTATSENAIIARGINAKVFVSGGVLSNTATADYSVIYMRNENNNAMNLIISGTGKVLAPIEGNSIYTYGSVEIKDSAYLFSAKKNVICTGSTTPTNTVIKIGGTSMLESTGSGYSTIYTYGNVEIKDNAYVSAANSYAINSRGKFTTILISGTSKVVSSGIYSAIFLFSSNTVEIIDNAQVIAKNNPVAISEYYNGFGNVVVSGGAVFAVTDDIATVVSCSIFAEPKKNGIILSWNREAGNTNYEGFTTDDILKLPDFATAHWDRKGGEHGIFYANGENTGFIPLNVSVLSIEEPLLPNLTVYPNPVSNILHIETNNMAPEIKVYSIQGVLLLQTKGNEIDMSSLAKGIYFAEIDGVCRKVVKQ